MFGEQDVARHPSGEHTKGRATGKGTMTLRHVRGATSRFAIAKAKKREPRIRSSMLRKQDKAKHACAATSRFSNECTTPQLQPLTFTKHLKEEVLGVDTDADTCIVEGKHGVSFVGYLRIATVFALGYMLLAAREYGLSHFL